MKEVKTYKLNGRNVSLRKSSYADGSLALLIYDSNEVLYGVATVNLCSLMQSGGMAFVDENNMPGIGQWLVKNKIAFPVGYQERSGFCHYQLYCFSI